MVSQAGWSGLFTINAEIYETEVRSTGVGWGNAAAKLGGLVSPALTGVIVDSVGGEVVVMILVMAWFAIVGISVVFVKETRVVKVVS